jgi:toxin ParE1/3/4
MKVRWTEVAFTELNEIHSYIAKDNPAAAKTVVIRIEQVVARLARFPHMTGTTGASGIRVFPALPFPYLVFYTAEGDELIIRNIRHGRRRRVR